MQIRGAYLAPCARMAKTHVTDQKKPADPKNPATKPHGTTADQVATMEAEGQGQVPPDVDENAGAQSAALDQEVDTFGAVPSTGTDKEL